MYAGKPRKLPDLNHSDLNHPASVNIEKPTDVENDSFLHDSSNNNVDTHLVSTARTFEPTIVTRLQQRKRAATLQPEEQTPAEIPETLDPQKLRLSS